MNRWLLLLFFLVSGTVLRAQQEGFVLRTYSTENGMPSNGIKGLQWDEQTGFLWMATEAGIVRFNGSDFKVYTKENTPRISSERMSFLVRNYEGEIYAADQNRNIFRIEANRVQFFDSVPQGDSIPNNLFLVAASRKFFATHRAKRSGTFFFIPYDRVVSVSDTLCYLRKGRVLHRLGLHSGRRVALPWTGNTVQHIFRLGGKVYLVNDENRLYRLFAENDAVEPVSLFDERGALMDLRNRDHLIYWENGMENPILFAEGQAWLLREESGSLQAVRIASNVPTNAFIRYAQYSRKLRMLFVGTDSKGLVVISQNRVRPKKNQQPGIRERNAYYAQVELPDGNILTNEGQVIGERPVNPALVPVRGAFVFSAFRTDSLLWYYRSEGSTGRTLLHRYSYTTGQTRIYDRFTISGLMALASVQGKVYIADETSLGYLDGDTLHYLLRYAAGLTNTPYDMQELESGKLTLATCNGLLRYDIAKARMDTVFRANDYCVRSLRKLGDYLVFGTYGKGFYIWKNGKVVPMPLDKNKYLLYAHCFIPDRKGFIWISTNRGLFQARQEELIHAFEHPGTDIYYHYYGKNDGMDITEMNGGCMPCALELADHTLSFPTMDGLLWVAPDRVSPILPEGKIYIDDVVINEQPYEVSALREALSPRTSDIVVRLAYPAWSNRENIYLEYRMNGEGEWKQVNLDRESDIRFSNLPSGSYDLQIRKRNGFGVNNYEYSRLQFSIATPWHQQWWFYLLVGVGIAALLMAFYQWRIRKHEQQQRALEQQVAEKTRELQEKNDVLEKNDNIKTRLISIISHDIVTPLKFVTVASKNLVARRKEMPEDLQNEALEEITNTSQELQLLSTNILNWIKYQNKNRRQVKEAFQLEELINNVFGVLRSLANQKQLQLVNEVPADLQVSQYYEPMKILVYNLVSNAISFSDKGAVRVSCTREGEGFVLRVSDEGVGMTPEQIDNVLSQEFIISSTNVDKRKGNGLGYLIIKDLVRMMDATLAIDSERGRGTTVSVRW